MDSGQSLCVAGDADHGTTVDEIMSFVRLGNKNKSVNKL